MADLSNTLHKILHDKFHFKDFHPGQQETLEHTLHGQPTLAILPTGSGKSLLYQIPAYLTSGLIVVVSPLISLMEDQVDRIRQQGDFKVAMLNSRLNYGQQQMILHSLSSYRFLFLSPETLVKRQVLYSLSNTPLSLFVVDEAHCISQWGPNFRPEYLLIKQVLQSLRPKRILMLTATATQTVATDIIDKMGLKAAEVSIVRETVNRDNIFLAVKRLPDETAKQKYLLKIVAQLGNSGVIYFSSKKVAGQVAEKLSEVAHLRVGIYHAGIGNLERHQIQQQFMNNELDVMCATSAFGMGINKNDIRYVIHYHMPGSIESYVQEFGRAGRDGHSALALLLYCPGDEQIQESLGQISLPSTETLEAVQHHRLPFQVLGDQQELLTFYFRHHYTVPQIEQILRHQNRLNQKRLFDMEDYVHADQCLRQIINHYFDGQIRANQAAMCCSNDQAGWQVDDLHLLPVARKFPHIQDDWAAAIDHLFY